jgi:hypothetical protein
VFKFNATFFGLQYTRVLYLDPDTDITWDDLCGFIHSGSFDQPIAEGMALFHAGFHNDCRGGPGRPNIYWRLNGNLVDLRDAGACKSGTVHVSMQHHWFVRDDVPVNPDCVYGPEDWVDIRYVPIALTCGK